MVPKSKLVTVYVSAIVLQMPPTHTITLEIGIMTRFYLFLVLLISERAVVILSETLNQTHFLENVRKEASKIATLSAESDKGK